MQLVNEDDGVLRFHQLFHDGLQAFFELAAILGASDDQGKIESQNTLICQERRNFAIGDALRQSFDDGSLTYARLADQYWVVLGAAAENINHALQFAFTSHQRSELGVHRGLGQVAGKLTQQGRFALTLRLSLFLAGTRQFPADSRKAYAAFVQDLGGEALLFTEQSQQKVLGSNVLVRKALSLLGSVNQNLLALVARREVDRGRDLLPARGVPLNLLAGELDRGMTTQEPVGEKSFVFAQKSQQQVLRLYVRRTGLTGLVAGTGDDAPCFLRVAFEHISPLPAKFTW